MRQFARRFVLLAGASIVVSGCLSPTLPLPPPVEPEVEQVGTGQYLLHGEIPEPGLVFILNKRTDDIYGKRTDKEYFVPIAALPKDPMQLWYQVGNEVSDIVEFDIPDLPAPSGTGGASSGTGGATGTGGADGG
jgi:hypothetical protein